MRCLHIITYIRLPRAKVSGLRTNVAIPNYYFTESFLFQSGRKIERRNNFSLFYLLVSGVINNKYLYIPYCLHNM